MTTSTPPCHIKKRLIKTVGAHTPCSCGYMQDGGQIARNEFCFVEGTPNYRYGASHEISAYRAQLASCGQVSYMPKYDFSIQTDVVLKITLFGQSSVWRTVTKLKDISVRLLKNMYEGPGIIISPIYKGKQRKEWFKR